MTSKYTSSLFLTHIFLAVLCVITFPYDAKAQSGVDLDLTVQAAPSSAQGGESYPFAIKVSNVGTTTATDVRFYARLSHEILVRSVLVGENKCVIRHPYDWFCSIDTLKPGQTVIVTVDADVIHFDEMSSVTSAFVSSYRGPINVSGGTKADSPVSVADAELSDTSAEIGKFEVSAAELEDNIENNYAKIWADRVPSKNAKPQVEIISPEKNKVFTKAASGPFELTIKIRAHDNDGKIAKITVGDPEFSPLKFISREEGVPKIRVGGKKYTAEEFESDPKLAEHFERLAQKVGEGLYIYTLRNLRYGPHTIIVNAIDDGGRSANDQIYFSIIGDAKIEITSPNKTDVFRPGSTITIETSSIINDPALSQLSIDGTEPALGYRDSASLPLMSKIAQDRNHFRHQYLWRDVPEGLYQIRVFTFNGGQIANMVQRPIVVAEPRIIKISSIKDGQQFEEGERITVSVVITDSKGRSVNDTPELLVNGKVINTFQNAYTVSELERGTYTFQVIARHYESARAGEAILGKSEVITVVVK